MASDARKAWERWTQVGVVVGEAGNIYEDAAAYITELEALLREAKAVGDELRDASVARVAELEAALSIVDDQQGCCEPGEWCGHKTYSELAVEKVADHKRIAELDERHARMALRLINADADIAELNAELKWVYAKLYSAQKDLQDAGLPISSVTYLQAKGGGDGE